MEQEICISNLEKVYPNGLKALNGVGFNVPKGALFALLGPNGAGKSTLVKILTSLEKPTAGQIQIGGISPLSNFAAFQQYIGVASQENELDTTETVEHLLRFQGKLFGLSASHAEHRANELIFQFGLTNERNKRAATLSGGNRRRLHCALALVHKPKVLFLDEPTVGMDPLARETFWQIISTQNKEFGVTVFLTTQYLDEADKHASQMALIIDGMLHFNGLVPDFKRMVNPSNVNTLEDSYIAYIRSLNLTCSLVNEEDK